MSKDSEREIPALQPDFFVVGVGASAGGLEALEELFREVPVDSGMAFVVVQHLSPNFKSIMDELLGRVTEIPIQVIHNNAQLKPNVIYVLPENHDVICAGGHLLLNERTLGGALSFPIDQFFRSLADDFGWRSVAIVLSGTGTDGSRGICHISEAGGLVIAQSEDSAAFNGMPFAAAGTGVVSQILSPKAMAASLLAHANNPPAHFVDEGEPEGGLQKSIHTVFHLLKTQCGVDFSDYKTATIGRRIQRRVMLTGLDELTDYVEVLRRNKSEVTRLYKDLLIGVTSFFRDHEVFDRLEMDVIPEILGRMKEGTPFRAWVVGTATGEEAYSLAIVLRECLDAHGDQRPIKVFATDVHEDSLAIASKAVYQSASLSGLSAERLNRFFVRKTDGYHVAPDLRQMVVCVAHNMIRDAPFTKIDLITCRNVLIYLNNQAQNKALSLFHFALNRNGVLCLGPSEHLGELKDEFTPVDEVRRIFRKHRDAPAPSPGTLNIPTPVLPDAKKAKLTVGNKPDPRALLEVYDSLLSKFMPPSLLIDEQGELIHIFEGADRFLRRPVGRMSSHVLDIVHSDLRATLAAAMRRARDEVGRVEFSGLTCRLDDGDVEITLVLSRFQAPGSQFLLVHFDSPRVCDQIDVHVDVGDFSHEEVAALERELQQTRDNLQDTIEQLQSTNHEFQSANEQLIASNEELQSANEELHSVNEELYTVNAEHQRKIGELTEMTDDMDNLLASTDVHTVFLDSDLRIRRFTPGIEENFNFLPQDVGRRIDSFTHSIRDADLVVEIQDVLENESVIEREVCDRSERWYLMRILPYESSGRVDGAVLTLIEITNLKRAERSLAELGEIVEHCDDAIMRLSTEGSIITWNAGAEKLFGFSNTEMIGQHVSMLVPAENRQEAASVFAHAVEGASVDRFETKRCCKDGRVIDVSLTLSPIRDTEGNVIGASEIVRDVTAQKQAEQEVREAVRKRDQFLAMLSHELRNPIAAALNATTLIREEAVDADTDDEARNIIERNIRHVARLLDDLLDLSRFTHDKITLHRQVVDLTGMAMDVVECVQPLLDEKQHQLHIHAGNDPIHVEGDVGRIQQAQVNLLVNAAKYTRVGGRIDYSLGTEGDSAVIVVRDNGMGMESRFLKDIFTPFVQSEQSLDRAQGGMGLGLPLVRMIVEAHGGSITASSDGLAKGSEFRILLPLTQQPVRTKPRVDLEIAEGKRMVIVEDNAGIRKMLAAAMTLKGFEVASAEDGSQGLDAILEYDPDVALIDIGLPDVNGYDLAKTIRQKPELAHTLLVAVTGYGRETDRQKAVEAGFDLHLVKPLDPNEVLAAVASHIQANGSVSAVESSSDVPRR